MHAVALAALGEQSVTVRAARALDLAQPLGTPLRVLGEALELGDRGALLAEQAGRGGGNAPQIVEAPADVGGIVARQGDAQRIGRAARRGGDQHALDGRFSPRNLRGQGIALRGDARRLRAHALRFFAQLDERVVRRGDGALGCAQRVARFALRAFLLLQLAVERVDAPAQRLEVLFLGRAVGAAGGQRRRQEEEPAQTLTFPCAATEAVRRATSSGSPR